MEIEQKTWARLPIELGRYNLQKEIRPRVNACASWTTSKLDYHYIAPFCVYDL